MNKRPKIFISHCEKNMAPTKFAMRILELIGCEPLIAENQPKGSKSVLEVVTQLLDCCDAAIVIATADQKNGDNYSPSNGVSEELGILKNNEKYKNRFFLCLQEGVVLSAMNSIARYSFTADNYSPIAEAILCELGSMNLFKNYYEMPGSDLDIHLLLEALNSLKELGQSGVLNNEMFTSAVSEQINKFILKVVTIS